MGEREGWVLYVVVKVQWFRWCGWCLAWWPGGVAAVFLPDLPAVLVDVAVAAPADQDEVVQVGAALVAFPPLDVVDLAARHGCGAADALLVAGDHGGALRRVRQPFLPADVEDLAVAVGDHRRDCRVAAQLPGQVGGDRSVAVQHSRVGARHAMQRVRGGRVRSFV